MMLAFSPSSIVVCSLRKKPLPSLVSAWSKPRVRIELGQCGRLQHLELRQRQAGDPSPHLDLGRRFQQQRCPPRVLAPPGLANDARRKKFADPLPLRFKQLTLPRLTGKDT